MRGSAISRLSRILVPILYRFSDFRYKPANSAPQPGLTAAPHHITNVGLTGDIPKVEPPNWATPAINPYNSYRRNAQGSKAFCAPDLQVYDLDVDYVKCPDLNMTVSVANLGCLGVGPGVPVRQYRYTAPALEAESSA